MIATKSYSAPALIERGSVVSRTLGTDVVNLITEVAPGSHPTFVYRPM